MIIKIAFDTEFEPDRESLGKVIKALGLEEAASVARTCSSIMETARRRSAGEQVIYKVEPKKRGRKPKNYKGA